MSNYIKNTNFTAKDNLTSGDPAKVIKGAEFDTEFNALQTAVNSKADSNNSQLTGTTDAQAVETTGDVTVGGNLSVAGNATISGNLTFGNADTDTVSFSADVNSNIIPDVDATYDLGSSSKEWRNLYLDGTAFVDGINLNGVNVSATASELNVLDGITASTAELNILDGITSTTTELNKLDGFTGSATDLNYAKDLRATGVTTTEFNKLDGLTATTTELNYTDGVTSNIQTQLNAKAASNASPTITLSGDVSGSATLTNLGNATITATIADDSHNHTIANVDGLQTSLDSKAPTASPTFTGTATIPTADVTDLDVDAVELKAIAESKAETAVDVFVYDTSKDSDGGAWRKRTQHTSWYNETLNTATRGSRKEFPAVAVIVAESDKVTIYDGDDPSMPMWMVFNIRYNSSALIREARITCVNAINGIVGFGGDSSTMGLVLIDFISDYARKIRNSAQSGQGSSTTIYKSLIYRNADSYISFSNGSLEIINTIVNDVAMTVLPNAPIDPATGLPIPTIAVATDGGVSVIKDDGTVVDSTSNYATPTAKVAFTKDYGLWYSRNTSIYHLAYASKKDYLAGDGFGTLIAMANGTGSFTMPTRGREGLLEGGGNLFLAGSNASQLSKRGVGVIHPDYNDFTKSMIALYDNTYNTGWMNGDIKLATLSDTDDTDLVGSELVTNGTFDTDISGWTSGNDATLSSVSGAIRVQRDSDNVNPYVYQELTGLTVGATYVLTADVVNVNGTNGRIVFGDEIGSNSPTFSFGNNTGSYSVSFTTDDGDASIKLQLLSADIGDYIDFDNISVRLAEPDRSVNGNGLQVFGTVTREPVATGADLVAYSGFSTSNYLVQPYNPDLDFGTGDFCYSVWVNRTSASLLTRLGGRADGTALARFEVYIAQNSLSPVFFLGSAGSTVQINSSIPVNLNQWTLITAVRKDNVAYLYINGDLAGTTTSNHNLTSTNEYSFYVGAMSYNGGATIDYPASNTSLALFRISATAPTAEQIAKIYRDEKVLFQEGAQATLHGTSDAVTALAYDTDTTLLHVGTSAGRSVFQGLRRVDNTTDAVGTAISASNNLVVEE